MQIIDYVVVSVMAKILVVIIMTIYVHKYEYTKPNIYKRINNNVFGNNSNASYRNHSYIYYL